MFTMTELTILRRLEEAEQRRNERMKEKRKLTASAERVAGRGIGAVRQKKSSNMEVDPKKVKSREFLTDSDSSTDDDRKLVKHSIRDKSISDAVTSDDEKPVVRRRETAKRKRSSSSSSSECGSDSDTQTLDAAVPRKSAASNNNHSSDGDAVTPDKKQLVRRQTKRSISSSSGSDSETDIETTDTAPQQKSPSSDREANNGNITSEGSGSESDVPLAKVARDKPQKRAKKRKNKVQEEKKGGAKAPSAGGGKADQRVKRLEKIARAAGILPVGVNYRRTFADCATPRRKLAKLRQMLRDAGMDGKPSLKAVEWLKMKKEAQELNLENIISSEGRSRRVAKTSRSAAAVNRQPRSVSPLSPVLDPRQCFANLRGIISSDEDSS